jgi:2-polyprenyl-3-methyl-5-hydroxy-6-metoxy-1,4-benzoquinol methylase
MDEIVSDLIRHGYSVNPETNIFQSPTYKDIAYNDGDESENRVLNAIKNAADLDSLSDELETHCTDWPSTYHLSKRRGNLLRPFVDHFKNKTVLEIGSGMGPITRLLGESDAKVLALEGTSRRAQATRLRTRDLENVLVISEKFDDFKTELKFDYITLIGVLEYSNLYSVAENPHQHVLQRCFELLSPNGQIIIAIENKLGLKYFAGAKEDHVGIPMFGLENLYDAKSVRTFGKFELENLLTSAGFESMVFNSPLPDYKLTNSVITSAGFEDEVFGASDLTRDAFGSDPQLPQTLAFNPELVLSTLAQNKLSLEFANSFLVVAGKQSVAHLNRTELAWHFSTNRKKAFCVTTLFRKSKQGIEVLKSKMSSEEFQGFVSHKINEESKYLEGRLFRDDFELLLAGPLWTHQNLQKLLKIYKDYLLKFQITTLESNDFVLLAGNALDLIPRNIAVNQSGKLNSFDCEWKANSPIELRQVLLRAVLSLQTISIFAEDEFGVHHTFDSLFKLFCKLLEIEVDESSTTELLNFEVQFQNEISGRSIKSQDFQDHFKSPMGRARFQPYLEVTHDAERDSAVAERDSAVAERDSAVAERDSAVAERDSAVAERDNAVIERDNAVIERDNAVTERDNAVTERDNAVTERDNAVAERDNAVAERDMLLSSKIWKVTKPYRWIRRKF